MRIRTKICGLTQTKDVQNAIALGADAIGLVFYESSPRYVTPQKAVQLLNKIPPFVSIVGLFVNPTKSYVRGIVDQITLDLLQFHGQEDSAFCESFNKPYLKAIHMKEGVDIAHLARRYQSARGLLLDSFDPVVPGGSGTVFDWHGLSDNFDIPFILAGGLNAQNVVEAIETTHPFGVDVSSGVELSKGIKDFNKMKQFLDTVQEFSCKSSN